MVTLRSVLAASMLALLAGCGGAASNADWLRTPESGAVSGDADVALEHEHEVSSRDLLSEAAPTDGPQRLAHTVTLGAVVAMPPSGAAASAATSSTTVIVNVNNTMQPAYAPYYGYGYGYGAVALGERGSSRPAPAPHSAAIIPGQSWPAPPSYGPSFPYSTSPASPWEQKR